MSGAMRGRRPEHKASILECMRHFSIRKWKYIATFEKCTLYFDIGLSPSRGEGSEILFWKIAVSCLASNFTQSSRFQYQLNNWSELQGIIIAVCLAIYWRKNEHVY